MKLLIVDDEELARERLAAMIAEMPDCTVVGEAGNGREAVEMAAALSADALLLDIAMPVMDGLEAARLLAQLEPAPAVHPKQWRPVRTRRSSPSSRRRLPSVGGVPWSRPRSSIWLKSQS